MVNVQLFYAKNGTIKMDDGEIKNCGELGSDGLIRLRKDVKDNMVWSRYGFECIHVHDTKDINNSGWYIVSQTGKGRISSFWTDNDCAPFFYGMAVAEMKGKVIFYNQLFDVVKQTDYVWASGFEHGYSKVCLGTLMKKKINTKIIHYIQVGNVASLIVNLK